jgi:hypothetical protein
MKEYEIGDILICSKHWYVDVLIVGDQYEVINSTNFLTDVANKNALNVKHIKTGKFHHFVDAGNFIPISVYRDYQLGKLLD